MWLEILCSMHESKCVCWFLCVVCWLVFLLLRSWKKIATWHWTSQSIRSGFIEWSCIVFSVHTNLSAFDWLFSDSAVHKTKHKTTEQRKHRTNALIHHEKVGWVIGPVGPSSPTNDPWSLSPSQYQQQHSVTHHPQQQQQQQGSNICHKENSDTTTHPSKITITIFIIFIIDSIITPTTTIIHHHHSWRW